MGRKGLTRRFIGVLKTIKPITSPIEANLAFLFEENKPCSAHFGVRVAEMFSARRARDVARPRQVAMYLTKMLTSLSYPEIGRQFGGRDHTTVMHAVRAIEGLMANDTRIAEDVQLLKSLLSN